MVMQLAPSGSRLSGKRRSRANLARYCFREASKARWNWSRSKVPGLQQRNRPTMWDVLGNAWALESGVAKVDDVGPLGT